MRVTATILLCLVFAADAHAATVSVSGATLRVTAAAGETNRLAIAPGTGVLSVTDAGAPLTAGDGCAAAGAAVQCASAALLGATVDLGDRDDTLTSTASVPLLVTDGDGADRVTGGSGTDLFTASPGADVYRGGGGSDTVSYAERTTAVKVDLDNAADDGATAEGDDVGIDVEAVVGGDGADTLVGDGSAEALLGGPGGDTLTGNGGDDRFDGSGADALSGGTGTDTVDYSARTDSLVVDLATLSSVENATGGSGNDRLVGTTAANRLIGGAGDDVLDGGTGADRLEGGTGTDTADYTSRTTAVTADLDGNADDGVASERDRIATDVEHLLGGTGSDSLVGDDDPNLLIGGTGNDALAGYAGDDVLDGSTGDDSLDGGDGNDRLLGAADNDALNGANGDDGLDGGPGNDRLLGGAGGDGLSGDVGDDVLQGEFGDDRLNGGDGADVLSGGLSDDVLSGGPGGDDLAGDDGWDTADYAGRPEALTIDLDDARDDGAPGEGDNVRATIESVIGGAGNDRLTGNAASNYLYGEGGADRLDGSGASDRLYGGAGKDTLVGGTGPDSMDGGDGADRISARDNSREAVRCGAGRDRATTDTIDMLFGCEKRTSGTANWNHKERGAGRVRGVRARSGGGAIVDIPGFPGEKIDRRLLADIAYLQRRYNVHITDGYARTGHAKKGEHPIGLAVDIVPGPGGSWSDIDRLARWAEPRQNRPRSPFRWVGYNGDRNHGRGNHLHLSWQHTPTKRGRTARTVWTLSLAP